MKYLFIAILFCFQTSFGQSDSTVHIEEFGWTIKLPQDYKVIDTATLNAESRSRESRIHWIKKPPATDTNYNRLLIWARDSRGNVFSISCIDSVHETIDPNFSKNALLPYGKAEISVEIYDGVKFNKLQMKMNTNPSYVNATLKTLYGGKVFTINYNYSDPVIESEILSMLKTSKFER